MTVYFIGAGPGAADLHHGAGRSGCSQRCQVCLYAGSLVPARAAGRLPAGRAAGRHRRPRPRPDHRRAGRAHDRAGLDVARLHSGDPSIFSAVAEQVRRLDRAGVPYEIVPGVPAFAAAAASWVGS